MYAGLDVGGEEGAKVVRLQHVGYGFRAGDEEPAAHGAGDRAEELAAEAGDFAVVVGREAAEEHGAEGEVGDSLVDHAGD